MYFRILKGNPCHKPAGTPEGGQFCSAGLEQNILNNLAKRYPHLSNVKVEMFDMSVYGEDLLATKSNTKLLLNPEKWNDSSFWEDRAKVWEGLISDTSKEGTVLHEIGHILDGLVLNKLDSKKYNALLEKHVPGGALYGDMTTPYGQEHISEMLAEAFVIREKQIRLSGMPDNIQNSILQKSIEIWDDFDKVLKA